ncbi:unnamed protein product, partial [Symbiodinium sp. KB8]
QEAGLGGKEKGELEHDRGLQRSTDGAKSGTKDVQEASDYAIRENGAVIPGQIGETKGDVTTIMEIGEEDRTSHGRRTFDQGYDGRKQRHSSYGRPSEQLLVSTFSAERLRRHGSPAKQKASGYDGDNSDKGAKQAGADGEKDKGDGRDGGRDAKLNMMKAKSFCSGCGRRRCVAMTTVLPADVCIAPRDEHGTWVGVADTTCARTASYLAKGVQSAQARHGQFPPQLFITGDILLLLSKTADSPVPVLPVEACVEGVEGGQYRWSLRQYPLEAWCPSTELRRAKSANGQAIGHLAALRQAL